MVRGEVGERPLLVDIIQRSVNYIKCTALNSETLANSALDSEISLGDDNNILSLAKKYTPYFQVETNYLSPKTNVELKRLLSDFYHRTWLSSLSNMPKACTYRLFKSDISFEKYLSVVKNHKHRIALSRLRLSSHCLQIEKGRHFNPPIPRSERKCPFCLDVVENESHFILNCPIYDLERLSLLQSISIRSDNFANIPTENQKFEFILSHDSPAVLCQLSSFVWNALKVRRDSLMEA